MPEPQTTDLAAKPRVTLTLVERVAIVTLSRPEKRNALDLVALQELMQAVRDALSDPAVRVLVLTGEGEAFCAGADLSALKGIADAEARKEAFRPLAERTAELIRAIIHAIASSDVVSLAAINGPAVGGGWVIALACDFRIAADTARFWFPEIGYARAIGDPTIDTLVELAGLAKAKEIALSARRYSAAEIAHAGLVHRVVPTADVMREAMQWAQALTSIDADACTKVRRRMNRRLVEIWRAPADARAAADCVAARMA